MAENKSVYAGNSRNVLYLVLFTIRNHHSKSRKRLSEQTYAFNLLFPIISSILNRIDTNVERWKILLLRMEFDRLLYVRSIPNLRPPKIRRN
jgi:hypothetical protein